MGRGWSLVLAAGLSVAGCSSDDRSGGMVLSTGGDAGVTFGGDGDGDGDGDAGGDGNDDGNGDSDTDGGDGLGPGKFDVADGNTGGTGGDASVGCEKMDLLFVVDNSISMADDQAKLIAAFPGFAQSIQAELADVDDYHIGVVTSSPHNHSEPSSCRQLGDLTNVSWKLNPDFSSTKTPCGPYAEGQRFMTQADDLSDKFACTAAVGDGGSSIETMADALLAALDPAKNAAGACNEGFLRDDALLVLVLLTDEDDEWSQGNAQAWADEVTALKGGYPDNVVVLSLVWQDTDPACAVSVSETNGDALIEFTQRFNQGFVGSLCSSDYGQFFTDSVQVVTDGCGEFIPPAG